MRISLRRLSRRQVTYISLVLAGIAIILIVVAVIKSLSAPAVGSVAQQPPSQAETIDPYKEPGTYNGKYVSFTYPAHYRKLPSALSSGFLEVVNFGSTDLAAKHISIGVSRGSLADDSGVSLRKQHPETYHLVTRTRDSLTYSNSINGSELTTFKQLGDLLVSVTVSSSGSVDLSDDSQVVVNSLHLK